MDREARSWDLLLAQSPFAAARLVPAFGYEGGVLTVGHPRNDVLRTPDAAERGAVVRAAIGLRADQTVVLYAPTWRDGVRNDNSRTALVSHLDAARLRKRLGDDVVVLLRGHSNTSRGRGRAEPHVVDVTDYPDLAELMLASDVLVTDYSSVMFDFCVTGKPMVFLVPDLAEYHSSTRGLYLDLTEMAPGPVVMNTDDLADELTDLTGLSARHAMTYATFVERFAPFDDGRATTRVVDALSECDAT